MARNYNNIDSENRKSVTPIIHSEVEFANFIIDNEDNDDKWDDNVNGNR